CELVIVSDIYQDTDTVALADIVFPALGFAEKDGTVTNSERRISRQRVFLAPPGEARADWQIICQLAKALGFQHGFNYQHPAQIFREHAALTT
ncbi:nitrate reductase, partial [Enterococcus faecalis]